LAWAVGFYADGAVVAADSIKRMNVDSIMDAPMLYEPPLDASQETFAASLSMEEAATDLTVRSAIANTVTRVGEKIILKRAASVSSPPLPLEAKLALSVGMYAHNSTAPKGARGTTGTVASAVLLKLRANNLKQLLLPGVEGDNTGASWRIDYRGLERALARQVVGFETVGVKPDAVSTSPNTGDEHPIPLYTQEFHTYAPLASRNPRYEGLPLDNVGRTLEAWSFASGMERESTVEVLDFLKWRIGEEVD
jgi:elongation factor Ts